MIGPFVRHLTECPSRRPMPDQCDGCEVLAQLAIHVALTKADVIGRPLTDDLVAKILGVANEALWKAYGERVGHEVEFDRAEQGRASLCGKLAHYHRR